MSVQCVYGIDGLLSAAVEGLNRPVDCKTCSRGLTVQSSISDSVQVLYEADRLDQVVMERVNRKFAFAKFKKLFLPSCIENSKKRRQIL